MQRGMIIGWAVQTLRTDRNKCLTTEYHNQDEHASLNSKAYDTETSNTDTNLN